MKVRYLFILYVWLIALLTASCKRSSQSGRHTESVTVVEDKQPVFEGWDLLIDKDTLSRWETIRYGGEGNPYMEGYILVLPMAINGTLTGVQWIGEPLPANNYMIAFEAKRIDGHDFFAGLTFSYNDTYATLVVGGWGGSTCGLSSIDGYDASDNETTTYITFRDDRWYPVQLRVTPDSIQASVDTVQVVDIATAGKKIHLRGGILATSLGLSTYLTTGEIRNLRIKRLL